MFETRGMKVFKYFNILFLCMLGLACLLPFIHIIAMSFSSSAAVAANMVSFWPVKPTIRSYQYVLEKIQFWNSLVVTLERVSLGTFINVFLTLLLAYPLSKDDHSFHGRTFYAWFLFMTMLFGGGLIPLYMVVSQLHLMDTIWALTVPVAVPVFNIILMLNFYRQIPKELSEAAYIDGASHWATLWKVYVPCSAPSIATITLFCIIFHWNSWFDGLIFLNNPFKYPLQTYLQTILIGTAIQNNMSPDMLEKLSELSDRTLKASQIIIATIPILMIYPFLQKYFVTGIVLGSVKG